MPSTTGHILTTMSYLPILATFPCFFAPLFADSARQNHNHGAEVGNACWHGTWCWCLRGDPRAEIIFSLYQDLCRCLHLHYSSNSYSGSISSSVTLRNMSQSTAPLASPSSASVSATTAPCCSRRQVVHSTNKRSSRLRLSLASNCQRASSSR